MAEGVEPAEKWNICYDEMLLYIEQYHKRKEDEILEEQLKQWTNPALSAAGGDPKIIQSEQRKIQRAMKASEDKFHGLASLPKAKH